MAESIQRILKRRALGGQHPQTPEQIGEWFGQTANAWNRHPTPFTWHGKRWQRRRPRTGDRRHRVGGSAAYANRPVPRRKALTRIIHEGWRRIRGAVGVAQAFERA
jgi:hypothetical protein